MVWNVDVFVKSLNIPGFQVFVESIDIPKVGDFTGVDYRKRQKFIDGLVSWLQLKNLHLPEIAWEVSDMQYGVVVRTQDEHPELKKTVVEFVNDQISYMLTHGTFAEFAYDKYFWVDADVMPKQDTPDVSEVGKALYEAAPNTVRKKLEESPFPHKLLERINDMLPPAVNERVVRDFNIMLPREQVLRSLNGYLRGLTKYFSNEVENLRYKWLELKECPATSVQHLTRIPCTREEASHIVLGVEIRGHSFEHLVAVSDILAATRFHQMNSVDFEYPFWLPAPQEWAQPLKESAGLDPYYTHAIDNMDAKEKLDLEFHRFQENLSQLMATTLYRATDNKLPQQNDGFIPLRAVETLLEDFEKWLGWNFSNLLYPELGEWSLKTHKSDTTTVTAEIVDTVSFKRYIVAFNYDDYFKGHIAAGLDWHPEARTFWRLPS
ncbi:hypothetical protein G173_gp102 [Erwinia phage phiEaH2]|uniref:Uncharacterized protein n=1 Tax=Erwinia phage phiEaH2 TaxID=1029988 RepID=J7KJH0_9CAUD|nr:hypothetical protein G173_gp102 [Erwinia phage phiEaH2]AFQ96647.1 hypothetical protein [Erwinia phage phiEaH2]